MMMVSGISYPERLPAVVVPPAVMARIDHTPSIETELPAVQPYAAAEFQQHPNPFDRSLQDSYDIHGKMVRDHEASGTLLSKLI